MPARSLVEYFKKPELFENAISEYEWNYINNARRDWRLGGKYGKFTAYTQSKRAFDQDLPAEAHIPAISEVLDIVIQWNGDTNSPSEIKKYGLPVWLDILLRSNREFLMGGLTLFDLEESHYQPLVEYLSCVSYIKKLSSNYAWVPVSKFLHTVNPCLFPIYDIMHVWNKIMKPYAGTFWQDYDDFCNKPAHRYIHLSTKMKPNEYSCRFNANYTYWAKEQIVQAAPELMPYFEHWFCNLVRGEPDPYNLKRRVHQFYGLAFEVIVLGADCLER